MMMAEELVSIQKNEYKATIHGELAEPLLLRSVALLPWLSYGPLKWGRSAFVEVLKVMQKYMELTNVYSLQGNV